MLAYRIADGRHPIYDATGAMLHGGRWNSVGQRVIYAAETYAGALLETLVHANLSHPPKNHMVVAIQVPESVAVERITSSQLQGWDSEDLSVSRSFGDRWIDEARTAVLLVPGIVTNGRENNVLINPAHSDFSALLASEPERVWWDFRLFDRAK